MTLITSIDQLKPALALQRSAFAHQPYPEYTSRVAQLKKLKALVLNHQQAFIDAMSQDFGHRSSDDSRIGDILTTVAGINYSLKRLKGWMKAKSRHVGLLFQPASASVMYQPLGVIGIIVPWNYPLFLALGPLTAAFAAGNRAMLKMSEHTPATSQLLAELLAQSFPAEQVTVVGGAADVAAAFSALPFDHLFFTGSTQVGRQVMRAAAENLVPVTLELGGKSPAIIAPEMDVSTAVSRMILGKTLNSGQTCVAPDYVLCPADKVNELVVEFTTRFNQLFPEIAENRDYSCMINASQYQRLQQGLAQAASLGALLIPLSKEPTQQLQRKIPLTLLLHGTDEMQLMQQEIFGPVLPIVSYEKLQDAITYVNQRPRPLALYLYSFDAKTQQQVMRQTHAGGVCLNDAAFHVAIDDLPFGGVGPSGMGQYHGEEGFKNFSCAKSVLKKGRISLTPLLFPPYGRWIHKLVYRLFIR